MASRHRVRAPCMQIIKTATVPAAACKRVNIKQFHDSKIRFPLMRRMARCGLACSLRLRALLLFLAHRLRVRRLHLVCCVPVLAGAFQQAVHGQGSDMQMHTDALIWGACVCAGRRRGRTRRSSRPCAPMWPCTERRCALAQRPSPKLLGSGLGCCAVPRVPRRRGSVGAGTRMRGRGRMWCRVPDLAGTIVASPGSALGCRGL